MGDIDRKRTPHLQNEKVRISNMLSDFTSPFEAELKKAELSRGAYYGRVNYIPFLEGGDARLEILRALAETTPTIKGCNHLYESYAVGAANLLVTRQPSDLLTELEDVAPAPVSPQEAQQYKEFLIRTLGLQGFKGLKPTIKAIAQNLLIYGNSWTELILSTDGTGIANIRTYDGDWGRYERTDDPNDYGKRVVICEDFANINLKPEVEFRIIGAFPNFTLDEQNGTLHTVIHSKTQAIGRYWYGMPYSASSIIAQYREFQADKYSALNFDNMLNAQFIIETEQEKAAEIVYDDDGNEIDKMEYLKRKARAFAELYANKGGDERDKLSFIYLQRAYGSTPSLIQFIPKSADTNWFKYTTESAADKIREVCGVNPVLLNSRTGGIADSGNTLYQAARAFMETHVRSFQESILEPIRTILDFLAEWTGNTQLIELTLGLSEPRFLKEMKAEMMINLPQVSEQPQQEQRGRQGQLPQQVSNSEQINREDGSDTDNPDTTQ